MITCPNCQHQELSGALFCSECGAQLRDYGKVPTQPFTSITADTFPSDKKAVLTGDPSASEEPSGNQKDDVVSLFVVDAKHTLHLSGRSEYTLGRVSEDQPIIPDVDLTEFDAYIMGVSRLHATIKVGRQRISIIDLGSANGTRVNGQRIVPQVDYPLKQGDTIALGKLIVQIVMSTQ